MRLLASMITISFTHYDCWKCSTERINAVFQGIVDADGQTENAIKHRINAGDKANNVSVRASHGIP